MKLSVLLTAMILMQHIKQKKCACNVLRQGRAFLLKLFLSTPSFAMHPPTSSALVDTYLAALTDAYLFYKVNRYDIKGKMHLKSESKYYICDTGLRNMILATAGKDIGRQIENIAYLELLRRGYNITIGKSGRGTEVDFVAVRDRKTEYYQVSASVLDSSALERELAPLKQIKDNYPKFLLTLDDFSADHDGIQQVNLIDWLRA
jgi:predicted AAA+ superfamily ATPase